VAGRRKDRKEITNAQVLTFVGAKGGCGVTTLATQLGILMAAVTFRKDPVAGPASEFGRRRDLPGFYELRYHSFELIENTDRLDAELLQSIVLHHSSGLDIGPGPDDFETLRHITPAAVAQTINFLRHRYEFILVDLRRDCTNKACN